MVSDCRTGRNALEWGLREATYHCRAAETCIYFSRHLLEVLERRFQVRLLSMKGEDCTYGEELLFDIFRFHPDPAPILMFVHQLEPAIFADEDLHNQRLSTGVRPDALRFLLESRPAGIPLIPSGPLEPTFAFNMLHILAGSYFPYSHSCLALLLEYGADPSRIND